MLESLITNISNQLFDIHNLKSQIQKMILYSKTGTKRSF